MNHPEPPTNSEFFHKSKKQGWIFMPVQCESYEIESLTNATDKWIVRARHLCAHVAANVWTDAYMQGDKAAWLHICHWLVWGWPEIVNFQEIYADAVKKYGN